MGDESKEQIESFGRYTITANDDIDDTCATDSFIEARGRRVIKLNTIIFLSFETYKVQINKENKEKPMKEQEGIYINKVIERIERIKRPRASIIEQFMTFDDSV